MFQFLNKSRENPLSHTSQPQIQISLSLVGMDSGILLLSVPYALHRPIALVALPERSVPPDFSGGG